MRTKQVREWLAEARRRLIESREPSGPADDPAQDAGLEAQVLLSSVLGKPRAWLLAHPEAQIDPSHADQLSSLLDQLAAGVPLPYLLGHWEFYNLDFIVSPAVLIPRPETELLVEHAVAWLNSHPLKRRAADVGTGSGCIAVSAAHQVGDLQILAVDLSWQALQIARQNAHRHGVSQRVQFVQSDLLSCAAGHFDLICANLPYIPQPILDELPVARHEPLLALAGGPDGLSAIQALLADAHRWLAPGGLILLEMQFDQSAAIQQITQSALPDVEISILNDLSGLPRLVMLASTSAV